MQRRERLFILAIAVLWSIGSHWDSEVVAEEVGVGGSAAEYGISTACSEYDESFFQVFTPPSNECASTGTGSSGSKFYVSFQAEHCLRSAHVTCMIGTEIVVDGDLYTSPGILVWLDRSFCVSSPSRFEISPTNPMSCTVTTVGGWISGGHLNGTWTTGRTPCCDASCGDFDRVDLGEIELCTPDDLKMVFRFVEWCDTVHMVRLVCEVPQDDPRAYTYYHWQIHGELNNLDRDFCFTPAFPGQPTECWLISYGGQFTGTPFFFTECTDCDP